jgi:MFS family permease
MRLTRAMAIDWVARAEAYRQTIGSLTAPILPLYWLNLLVAISVGMVPPLLPELAAHWALSTVQAGLIYTVYAVGRLGSCYPASRVRAQWGTRTALVVGIVAITFGLLTCGLSAGFMMFLVGRVLMGVGMSATSLALVAELLERAPLIYRGRFTNAFEGVTITSQSLGSFAVGPLALVAGWRGSFLGAGAIALLGLTTCRRIGPLAGRRASSASRLVEAGGRRELRGVAPVYGASFAMALTWSGLFSTLAPLVGHHHYGLSLAVARDDPGDGVPRRACRLARADVRGRSD